jgi:hypothetical protein
VSSFFTLASGQDRESINIFLTAREVFVHPNKTRCIFLLLEYFQPHPQAVESGFLGITNPLLSNANFQADYTAFQTVLFTNTRLLYQHL